MNISTNACIPEYKLEAANRKLEALFLELAVRNDNYYVGSGLGGNNFQILSLFNLEHELLDCGTITVLKGNMAWGVDWLINTPMKQIRKELDSKFESVSDLCKSLALPTHMALSNLDSFYNEIQKNKRNLEKVMGYYHYRNELEASSDNVDIVNAMILCTLLSKDFDAGIENDASICRVAEFLEKCSLVTVLLSVRICIGIERLVRHNLDEHHRFSQLINRVNRRVN